MGLGLEVRGGFFRSGHPAAEVLFEKDGVKVSRETLRRWMVEDGLWLSRKQRRSFHQPRLRREAYGELIQIDGSEHRWFEDRGAPCSLLVFIDDATGKLMQLLFVPSESTSSYFDCLRGYLDAHGCPVAWFVPILVYDAAARAQSRHMRVKFHTIAMPHGKLFLGIAPIRFAREWVPRPYLVWIEQVQLLGQSTRCQLCKTANKVSV